MDSGGRPVGQFGDHRGGVRHHSCQTVTPETSGSTHYFFQQARHTSEGDHSIAENALPGAVPRVRGGPGDDHGAGPRDRARPLSADAAAGDGRGRGALSQIVAEAIAAEGGVGAATCGGGPDAERVARSGA